MILRKTRVLFEERSRKTGGKELQRGALGLTQGFVISFHENSTGRWAILLLLSSQASSKMLGNFKKEMYRTSMSDLVPPSVVMLTYLLN